MKVDKQELIKKMQELKEKLCKNEVITDDEEWTLIIAIACIDSIEEE